MSELFKHANNKALTANGAETYASSLDSCVDFFFLAGSSRGKDISAPFIKAMYQDKDVALRILQWLRDVRGGAGERKQFRDLLHLMITDDMPQEAIVAVIHKIPELGRWDDLHGLFGTKYEFQALHLILTALKAGNALCAKWTPRKGVVFNTIRKLLKVTPKQLRKTLVNMSNTVEQKMCAKLWNEIEFGKLPSIAASRYSNAFARNSVNYAEYKAGLESGEEKINAGAIFPHDIVTNVMRGQSDIADAQWKALPDYLDGTTENILPVVDVSGSMSCPVGDGFGATTCIQVAISLGIYLAERNKGVFKDKFITFSNNPTFEEIKGSNLAERVHNLKHAEWGFSTDLQAVFRRVLHVAMTNELHKREMPSTIIILSDMEFNSACRTTNLEAVKVQYAAVGYTMPKLVFWNLHGRAGNSPARASDGNTALVSGFSPAIMKSVLSGEDFTPKGIMLETVMVDRYAL